MIDKAIDKLGRDNVLHFGIGGLIGACVTITCMLQDMPSLSNLQIALAPTIGMIVVAFLAWFKEYANNRQVNGKHILAAVLGNIPLYIATSLGVLFQYLSYNPL